MYTPPLDDKNHHHLKNTAILYTFIWGWKSLKKDILLLIVSCIIQLITSYKSEFISCDRVIHIHIFEEFNRFSRRYYYRHLCTSLHRGFYIYNGSFVTIGLLGLTLIVFWTKILTHIILLEYKKRKSFSEDYCNNSDQDTWMCQDGEKYRTKRYNHLLSFHSLPLQFVDENFLQ